VEAGEELCAKVVAGANKINLSMRIDHFESRSGFVRGSVVRFVVEQPREVEEEGQGEYDRKGEEGVEGEIVLRNRNGQKDGSESDD
jgi:hypothetical protein